MFNRHTARQIRLRGTELPPTYQPQPLRPETYRIHHQHRRYGFRQRCSQSRARHAHAGSRHRNQDICQRNLSCWKDQKAVKHHIQPAHHDVQPARHLHITAALQRASGGMAHLRGRKRTGIDQEIPGSIPSDLFRSAQPDRKI